MEQFPPHIDVKQKLSIIIGGIGLLGLLSSIWIKWQSNNTIYIFLSLIVTSVVFYTLQMYRGKQAGIKNDGVWYSKISNRSIIAWILALILTGFYCLLYWNPTYLGLHETNNTGLIALFDPLSFLLKNQAASEWFVYGTLYTLAIVIFGIKFIYKYRHNRYQIFRTISILFFQLIFAYLLPEFMLRMKLPYNDFKNMWPLNYYFFDNWHISELINTGKLGIFMLSWGILMIIIVSPVLTYLYGKRWYCSWVCGCGGLAETAGDNFRQLSNKSTNAWRLERIIICTVLFFVVIMTAGVIYSSYSGEAKVLGISTSTVRNLYGFIIGACFSGVIGVGFYPILGTRVWCRFGCPMAAILGIQQKLFSRFRITTNGGQCISCGNCSTYCEMGIDVRAYAQMEQNIVRASCVGCGICAAVCPRGVLKLENGSNDINMRSKTQNNNFIKADAVKIIS